ncbi:MAG TPA: leucine--tRNA ligase, partial [Armatimonadota bacterium]|nr:leucine--tRNA ligase [Armatimonadota bacterium]
TDEDESKPKHYALTMLPYPSGDLHVGHWYPMTPSDTRARFMRMNGYRVFFPIGFDAFGLPAENAAIQRGIHPRDWTFSNIERMRDQLKQMGAMFDFSSEIVTCDPEYYRWNQWFFLRFLEKGLAYRAFAPVDWCPSCNTTLAREQVLGQDRRCERCGAVVIKKDLNQWYLKITDYAEELLDLGKLDWPEHILALQRNWIGRSEGAQFSFAVAESDETFGVFTTRPDTIYGVTFCVLAPEHPLVGKITTPERRAEVEEYVLQTGRQTEIDRLSTEKERTGVFTGAYAVHPFTGERVPIYIADYVLMTYGTGGIMAVPAHDERDFDFARKYGIEIRVVIVPPDWDGTPLAGAYGGEGVMANSGPFDGMPSREGKGVVARELEARGIGGPSVNFRIRDWLISRQRMWGTPIPIVHCAACGPVPVPDDQLPVVLPEDVEFRPTGESPLKFHDGFRLTPCPKCGGPGERETDTMDTFVDSSWYQYRYLSPHDAEAPVDPEAGGYWLPVDLYNGGSEHAVMHLLYTRFFHKVMRDLGLLDPMRAAHPEREWDEPFPKLFSQGIITSFAYTTPDGRYVPRSEVAGEGQSPRHRETDEPLTVAVEKMSKSKLNVVAPDEYVQRYGADVVRLFLMFIGPWEQGGPWDPRGVEGVVRFLNRVWTLVTETAAEPPSGAADATGTRELQRAVHQTLRKVTGDLERFSYNTMVAALMELSNTLQRLRGTAVAGTPAWREALELTVLMLAPAAPHITEELWERLGRPYSVHTQPWPAWSEELAAEESVEIIVQVNGKLRDRLTVPVDADEETVRAAALASEKVQSAAEGKTIRKVIYVPGRLLNLVVG